MSWYAQSKYDLRFEWGLEGAKNLGPQTDLAIIVDVLSFSTCVDIAVSSGVEVYPFPFKDDRVQAFAESIGAICASPTRSKDVVCLSPSTLLRLQDGAKLVLPSPNGATISFALQNHTVMTGCLRNASAVANMAQTLGEKIVVIACGELWEDGTLRPSLEDMIGAGSIISKLQGRASPEATAATQVFQHFHRSLEDAIARSSSGQELISLGFAEDVAIASALDVSRAAPILHEGAFKTALGRATDVSADAPR